MTLVTGSYSLLLLLLKVFTWLLLLNTYSIKSSCAYASKLEVSCLSNAHALHICPAFSQTCLEAVEEFFGSSWIFGLLKLLLQVVPDIGKSFLKKYLFIDIYSMFLLFCIPGLPFARHHLFLPSKKWKDSENLAVCLAFIDYLRLLFVLLLSGSHLNCCQVSECKIMSEAGI